MDDAQENPLEPAESFEGTESALDEVSSLALWDIVARLAEQTRARTVDAVVQALDRSASIQTTTEPSLGTLWLDFCAQVQGEQSSEWNEFVTLVEQVIESELLALRPHEREALWLLSPAGADWRDEPDTQASAIPVSVGDLVEYLYSHVWQEAAEDEDPRISGLQPGDDADAGDDADVGAFDADDIAGIEHLDRDSD